MAADTTPDPAALCRELIVWQENRADYYINRNTPKDLMYDAATVARWALEQHAAAERLRERVAKLEAACKMVRQRWSFSNDQQHTHTWHDMADCASAIHEAMKESPT